MNNEVTGQKTEGKRPTQWGYSRDGETYTLADNREEALEECTQEDGFCIAELAAQDWLPSLLDALDVHEVTDRMRDHFYDNNGAPNMDECEFVVTEEQLGELRNELIILADTWLTKHKLRWSTWYEVVSGTEERIEEGEDSDDA